MTPITDSRLAADATKLATRRWISESPRAAVVLVHGLAEHAGRYDHIGSQFAAKGFDVRATDLRGFGRSGGERAYVEDFSTYVDDLADDITGARELGVPVVLLGHSLGGLVAALYVTSDRPQPSLLVLSAPAIAADLPKAKALLARVLVRVLPKLKVSNGLKGEQLSRDPEVGRRYFADPLVVPKSSVRLGVALMEAMERVGTALDQITLPTLVVHGGADSIVAPSSTEQLGELPSATRVVFEGFRHEVFNEAGGTLAVATIADWIDSQL